MAADVFDVAEAVLQEAGPQDSYSLQKLVYYAQAVHLARRGAPLFDEPIKAWVNGPVVPALWHANKGSFIVRTVGGDPDRLRPSQEESVHRALRLYGGHSSDWLIAQTHLEPPWVNARRGLPRDDKSSPPIDLAEMATFYKAILDDPEVDAALTEIDAGFEVGLTADELRALA